VCASDPIVAVTSFVTAIETGNDAALVRCDHLPTPFSDAERKALATSSLRLDAADRDNRVTPPLGPNQVAVRVPGPDTPNDIGGPPHQSGVIFTTTLEHDSYYVTAVLYYSSS
jgi:hypothetical protein